MYFNFDKGSVPFRPSYNVVEELNSQKLDSDDIIVHLNVFIKTIKHKNEESLMKFAEYDSVTQASRVNIEVIDYLGDRLVDIKYFDSKIR